ncbi:hypothetical protein BB559_007113 [Furculomyces boomerangus]|uniref:Uncharacterized protein n=2 Tax=Harpellales TaxID=61421 RepID=A0A2T9XYV1_9FUNG|nr:hypothetical protein BB559_007113 [Furculomyces boomerangus]
MGFGYTTFCDKYSVISNSESIYYLSESDTWGGRSCGFQRSMVCGTFYKNCNGYTPTSCTCLNLAQMNTVRGIYSMYDTGDRRCKDHFADIWRNMYISDGSNKLKKRFLIDGNSTEIQQYNGDVDDLINDILETGRKNRELIFSDDPVLLNSSLAEFSKGSQKLRDQFKKRFSNEEFGPKRKNNKK